MYITQFQEHSQVLPLHIWEISCHLWYNNGDISLKSADTIKCTNIDYEYYCLLIYYFILNNILINNEGVE